MSGNCNKSKSKNKDNRCYPGGDVDKENFKRGRNGGADGLYTHVSGVNHYSNNNSALYTPPDTTKLKPSLATNPVTLPNSPVNNVSINDQGKRGCKLDNKILVQIDNTQPISLHGNSCSPRTYTYARPSKNISHAQSNMQISYNKPNIKNIDLNSQPAIKNKGKSNILSNQNQNTHPHTLNKNHIVSQTQINKNIPNTHANIYAGGSLGSIGSLGSVANVTNVHQSHGGNTYTNIHGNKLVNNKKINTYIGKSQSKKNISASVHKYSNYNNPVNGNNHNTIPGNNDNRDSQDIHNSDHTRMTRQKETKPLKLPKIAPNNPTHPTHPTHPKQQPTKQPALQPHPKRKYSKSQQKIQTQPCEYYASDEQSLNCGNCGNVNGRGVGEGIKPGSVWRGGGVIGNDSINGIGNGNIDGIGCDRFQYSYTENGSQGVNTMTIDSNIQQEYIPIGKQKTLNNKNKSRCSNIDIIQPSTTKKPTPKPSNPNPRTHPPTTTTTTPKPHPSTHHPTHHITSTTSIPTHHHAQHLLNKRNNTNIHIDIVGSPASSKEKQSIKEALLNIVRVRDRDNRHLVSIDEEIEKLDNLTRRYTCLRKDLVSIQEDIITMSFKEREKRNRKDRDRDRERNLDRHMDKQIEGNMGRDVQVKEISLSDSNSMVYI